MTGMVIVLVVSPAAKSTTPAGTPGAEITFAEALPSKLDAIFDAGGGVDTTGAVTVMKTGCSCRYFGDMVSRC